MFTASLGAGIVQGAIIAMAATGFTLIYNATGVVNFANGPMMVFGANVGFIFYATLHWPFALSAVMAVAAGAVLGAVTDRVVIAPLRQATLLMQVMSLVALALVLDSLLRLTFGAQPRNLPAFASTVATVPGLGWSPTDLIVMGVTLVVTTLLALFLRRTKAGLAMRATASNHVGVGLIGINPRNVALLSWTLGGGLTALAGILILPQVALVPGVGATLTFLGFAAVVLGGFGSLPGAVLGGLLIGVVDALVGHFIAAGYEPFVSLAIMMLVLAIRPAGLLGVRTG
jgi:branched-chain amino acid transport system permease protein